MIGKQNTAKAYAENVALYVGISARWNSCSTPKIVGKIGPNAPLIPGPTLA